jgi:mannitol/fructose-specific phosphotransferase system IIA component
MTANALSTSSVKNMDNTENLGHVTPKAVSGLITRDVSTGTYIGTIIGFPHIEYTGNTASAVEQRLQDGVKRIGDDLVLEAEFVGIVRLQ